ncbi:hypothetical protein WN48_09315 [Eufriesea mexicana]|nr:hypothetical protein WN48_09315 [Eufriesea mexicana]
MHEYDGNRGITGPVRGPSAGIQQRPSDEQEEEARRSWSSKGKPNSGPSGPFSSRLSGLPVGFSIPIQRGASEPNYYDSSPLDSVGPFDLPPFSMIPRYLGRAHCVLPVVGDPRAADRYGGVKFTLSYGFLPVPYSFFRGPHACPGSSSLVYSTFYWSRAIRLSVGDRSIRSRRMLIRMEKVCSTSTNDSRKEIKRHRAKVNGRIVGPSLGPSTSSNERLQRSHARCPEMAFVADRGKYPTMTRSPPAGEQCWPMAATNRTNDRPLLTPAKVSGFEASLIRHATPVERRWLPLMGTIRPAFLRFPWKTDNAFRWSWSDRSHDSYWNPF